ncbi:hypothetical protein BU17DRAFT_68272 [Hysterangium stoloniferum]|nr:hypothetical protein BU17DRAFT_68272 [Hysterangium stoloniferum]
MLGNSFLLRNTPTTLLVITNAFLFTGIIYNVSTGSLSLVAATALIGEEQQTTLYHEVLTRSTSIQLGKALKPYFDYEAQPTVAKWLYREAQYIRIVKATHDSAAAIHDYTAATHDYTAATHDYTVATHDYTAAIPLVSTPQTTNEMPPADLNGEKKTEKAWEDLKLNPHDYIAAIHDYTAPSHDSAAPSHDSAATIAFVSARQTTNEIPPADLNDKKKADKAWEDLKLNPANFFRAAEILGNRTSIWLTVGAAGGLCTVIGITSFFVSIICLTIDAQARGVWITTAAVLVPVVIFLGFHLLEVRGQRRGKQRMLRTPIGETEVSFGLLEVISRKWLGHVVVCAHLLPKSMAMSTGSLFAGWIMSSTGKYRIMDTVFGICPAIATTLLTRLNENSAIFAQWFTISLINDQIPLGFDNSVVFQTTPIAVLVNVIVLQWPSAPDLCSSGVVLIWPRTGQVCCIAFASAVFQFILDRELTKRITGPDAADLVGTRAWIYSCGTTHRWFAKSDTPPVWSQRFHTIFNDTRKRPMGSVYDRCLYLLASYKGQARYTVVLGQATGSHSGILVKPNLMVTKIISDEVCKELRAVWASQRMSIPTIAYVTRKD